jgi:hypothetical protein
MSSRPVSVPLAELGEIQHSAADGGFVASEWRTRAHVKVGDLVRGGGEWLAVADRTEYSYGGGYVVRVGLRDSEGLSFADNLYDQDGREVRQDTRIDFAAV